MVGFAICDVWGMGGKGALELADEVVKQSKINSKLTYSYDLSDSVKTKIKKLAKQVYGTTKVVYSKEAEKSLKEIKKLGFDGECSRLSVIIHEGQNHQVRRMFAAIGKDVKFLKRQRIGSVTLGGLKRGEYRPLRADEISALVEGK